MTDHSRPSDAILARLLSLHPKIIDLSLGRTLSLLEKLGRPQDRLPPVVHLAGTNGKGSTHAFLRSILEQAGYKVHAYTSPHLVQFSERIRLAGEIISEDALSTLLEEVEQINGGEPITYFEITTCAALKAFAETPADILLLETGLGGRLDSTNVVDQPICTAITPISMDHCQFLGDTLEKIAAEKAAIQKIGTPSIVAPQDPKAMAVITMAAQSVGAPLHLARPVPADLTLGLLGDHQRVNAGTAIAVADILKKAGFILSDRTIADGLASAYWPARLQRLTRGPFLDLLSNGAELWLDGGHNEAAAGAIAATAKGPWKSEPLTIILGMLNTKAAVDFIITLKGLTRDVATVAIPGEENSFSAAQLAAIAREAGVAATPYASVQKAIESQSVAKNGQAKRFLICGSLYLAGYILRDHG